MTEWIKKKSDPKWITKKEKPKWITKKEKPKKGRGPSAGRPDPRKRLSPTDKFKRDVLGQDMSDKYKEIKGRKKFQHGGRTNLLEELGRVEGERSNKNRRAEVSRIHGELNKGYKKGGRSGYGSGGAVLKGKKVGIQIK